MVVMYFREPEEIGANVSIVPGGALTAPAQTISSWAALAIATIGIFVLGILPMLLTNIAKTFYAR